MRHAFIKGIGIVARRAGKTVPELMAEWIEEDWKAVITAMGKYTVRESAVTGKVEHEHKHDHAHRVEPVTETGRWLAGLAGAGADSEMPESRPH